MFRRRIIRPLLIPTLIVAALCVGCGKRGAETPSNAPSQQASAAAPPPAQNSAVEVEIIGPQEIAGSIAATGKVLVMEDRVANIGPVHEGRLVNLYAGQGSVVRKGQKLADLESADIDQAEADYLKVLADLENANRTSADHLWTVRHPALTTPPPRPVPAHPDFALDAGDDAGPNRYDPPLRRSARRRSQAAEAQQQKEQ